MGELDGKVAIVTGSARGIGEATARKLSEQGAKVVISDLDGDLAAETAASMPGETAVHSGNLLDAGVCDELVKVAADSFGQLDILVNNAGFAWDGPIHKATDEQWDAMIGIHCTVPFRMLRAASPLMREAAKADKGEGVENFRKVVNVSSLAGAMGNAGQVPYAAGKGGVIGLTKALAKEWGQLKICVNAIAFGAIDTRLTKAVGEQGEIEAGGQKVKIGIPEQARSAFEMFIPFQRAATPEEAARGIYWLCSPGSDYVHGQVINVSGGLQMGMSS